MEVMDFSEELEKQTFTISIAGCSLSVNLKSLAAKLINKIDVKYLLMMVWFIDKYLSPSNDSFAYELGRYFGERMEKIEVERSRPDYSKFLYFLGETR